MEAAGHAVELVRRLLNAPAAALIEWSTGNDPVIVNESGPAHAMLQSIQATPEGRDTIRRLSEPADPTTKTCGRVRHRQPWPSGTGRGDL